jgi:hypothetical protein
MKSRIPDWVLAYSRQALIALALLCALALGSSAAPAIAAGPELTITPASATIDIGESTVLTVHAASVTNLYGYQFQVNYDAAKLSATGAFVNTFVDTTSNAFAPGNWSGGCSSGVCRFAITRVSPAAVATGSGPIAQVTFTGVSAGTIPITISANLLGDRDGMSLAHTASGASITVTNFTTVNMPFQADWNLIDMPVDPEVSYTAKALLQAINSQGGNCVEIDRWLNGGWDSHLLAFQFNNFAIEMGRGYFVRCTQASSWGVRGTPRTTPVTVSLYADWNLIGVPYSPSALTAKSLLTQANGQGGNCSEIDRWQNGGWDSHLLSQQFNNFPIESYRGYFVKCTVASTYTPQ